jgi:hypothetical protein
VSGIYTFCAAAAVVVVVVTGFSIHSIENKFPLESVLFIS